MNTTIRRAMLALSLIAVFALGVTLGQNKFGQPKSVVHVVALKWKADAKPEDRQKALDGIKVMAAKIPGITNIWIKSTKVQGISQEVTFDAAFVIEFKDAAAHQAYGTHPAHDEWMKLYDPVRDQSRNQVITN